MWLLEVMRRLPGSPLDLYLVLLRGGELELDLAELGEVRVVGEPVDPRASTAEQEQEPARVAGRRAALSDLGDADLVIVNTAWSAHALAWLPPGTGPVLVVVHELDDGLRRILPPEVLSAVLGSEQLVVGCGAVRRLLEEHYGVGPDRIVEVPYGVTEPGGGGLAPGPARSDVDLSVVAAGVAVNRKGPDLFVHLAGRATIHRPDHRWRFRWIGARPEDSQQVRRAMADADRLGVADQISFGPPTKDLRAALATADAFVLTSREDAFPLVVLEAAAARLPVAAFTTSGVADLLTAAGQTAIAYPDLDAMAERLVGWIDDEEHRLHEAEALHDVVVRDHDIVNTAKRFRETLDPWLLGQLRP